MLRQKEDDIDIAEVEPKLVVFANQCKVVGIE